MKTGAAIALTIGIIVALAVGGWFAYWAVAKANIDQQYQVNTDSQQYQSGLESQERDRVAAYDDATDDAQKKNIATTFCAVFSDLTHPAVDLVQANARICN